MLAPAFVVTLAALVRVAWVLLVPTKPVGDFAMYLESAAYLLEHGALDPEFVYMPGYVAAAAGVMGLGGGLLAIKLVLGALLSAAGAGAVYGLAAAFWGRGAALAGGLAYALWPAGIAASSVTGTDMPTGVLILIAAWALVKGGRGRPWVATVAFGLGMGLAAWVRAVAVPLAAFAVFYFRAAGATWRQAIVRSGAGALIALLVLAPWVLRNHDRYGEWMLTDSHGGLTALVGANPNTDGRYSRSLNRLFKEVTGYTLLAEPHRQADRAAYDLARDWSAFSPRYAVGLVALKAERLLDQERPLLYWPLYRSGVLRPGPAKAFFDRHRRTLERWTDAFWFGLCAATFAGIGLALARRRWIALAFVPVQLALVGVYALYFAEVRYHLPIAALMFPLAAGVAPWLAEVVGALGARLTRAPAAEPAGEGRSLRGEAIGAALALAVLLAGWPAAKAVGVRLRETHRWAAHVCRIAGAPAVCKWAPEGPGPSPVRGVYDGLGLDLVGPGGAAARLSLDLPAGRHALRARLDLTPAEGAAGAACQVRLGPPGAGAPISLAETAAATRRGETVPVEVPVEAGAGALLVTLEASCPGPAPPVTVWLSGLEVVAR
jgi:4-amino-4-deoxy-L-arabinose transferase-like glycosyltransferase